MAANTDVLYGQSTLPTGIRSRRVDNGNGLTMHCLEAGDPSHPCVLCLHGFPELAYSWRHILIPIAEQGYHVIAPDQRGYGLTTGWDPEYDGDLPSYRMLNLVRDTIGLLFALGHTTAAAVVGHDFGSPVASWASLIRPDIFRSVVLMSSPFGGPPSIPVGSRTADAPPSIHEELARLSPPRKHYQAYYTTRDADADMRECPQGVHDFLRAYYHHKSADWSRNQPHELKGWTASAIAEMPRYYVMDLDKDMAATVAEEMPSVEQVAKCGWLPEEELRVYSDTFSETGFQGGLQWYRCASCEPFVRELQTYTGRTIDTPACYIAGKSDWGTYQKPGNFEKMRTESCTDFRGAHLIDGAGHWVQQERPQQVADVLGTFLGSLSR